MVLLDVEGTTTPISFVKARGGANVGARAAVGPRPGLGVCMCVLKHSPPVERSPTFRWGVVKVWERRSNFRDCGVGELGLSAEEKLFPYAATAVDSWIQTANLADVAKEFEKQCKEDFCPAKCGRQNVSNHWCTRKPDAKGRSCFKGKQIELEVFVRNYFLSFTDTARDKRESFPEWCEDS